MSSTSQPQNVGVEGTSEKLKLSWKVEPGMQDYATASHTCTNLGSGWHLAATAEMDKLFLEPDFRKPQEVDCLTSFWTSPASASGAQCVANTRGFRYDSTNPTNPLPINSDAVLSSQSATEGVSVAHSVMCINGQLLPDVPCGTAVNQLLLNSPLGIVDAATGLTWANITVQNFTDSDGVAAQCAKGASAGWRMPTKGELETAIKNDIFKTAVFAGNDATCPLAWHKPDVTTTNKTCAGLGAGKDGVISFKTDAACAAGASLVVAKPTVGAVLGLCVKDK